ncbi:hypothetical protein H4S06_000371 [Coemansia sp. BCRC 34490]|nr:hypothetical protein H4S06_000371 [Coemansia sp. BCRC 34490]
MSSVSIISLSGYAYQTNEFQSLSGKRALQLRTGSSAKQQREPDYLAPQWCPTLDILAVPEGRALRLVRLSGGDTIWRRTLQDRSNSKVPKTAVAAGVAGKSDDGDGSDTQCVIRAIAWDPTGQYIAVLYSDGTLVQRDAAHGDIVHESKIELADNEPVASMVWVCCGSKSEPSTNTDAAANPPAIEALPFELSLPKLGALEKSKATPSHINSESTDLTAVIITTADGAVWVLLDGIFALPVAKPPLDVSFTDHTVANAQISRDLSTLYIFLTREKEEQQEDRPNAAICRLDTPILSTASPLLRSLVYLSARISGLFLYIENAMESVESEAATRNEAASRAGLLQKFESILQDHGVDEATSPEAELCRLAMTGRASEATSQFLLAKMKTASLKSWENSGRQGAAAIIRLIYQYVTPAIERTILAVVRFLHILTTDFLQLSLSGFSFGDSDERHLAWKNGLEATKRLILRAVVVLGWMYARFEEYAGRLRDEQRENQVFVDWALLAVEDLNWQNEGIRKTGNDDTMDDGTRPVRPEIDYKLLLRFIRSAFRRKSAGDALGSSQEETQNILSVKDDRSKAVSDVAQTYFEILAERANGDSLQNLRSETLQHMQEPLEAKTDKDGVFGFVFHSPAVLDEATRRCADTPRGLAGEQMDSVIVPPTCNEALTTAKSLVLQALTWPSAALGDGLQWNAKSVVSYFSKAMCVEGAGGDLDSGTKAGSRISDMHCVVNAASDPMHGHIGDADTMYLACVAAGGSVLEILAVPGPFSEEVTKVASIELSLKVRDIEGRPSEMERLSLKPVVEPLEESRAVRVAGISFFDDELLGVTFTIDGCHSPYLGAIAYRQGSRNLTYLPVPSGAQDTATIPDSGVAADPLEFSKLLKLDDASSKYPVGVSTNGRPGRRSIAVVEKRGKFWWPYDMDNAEEDDDE